jgi:hypothetical protein
MVCVWAATATASGSGGGGYYGGGAGLGFAPGWPKDGGGAGSSYWLPSASDTSMATDATGTPSVTITALDLPQSIAFTSSPPTPATVGGRYPVSAQATSGLPVTFSVDASSTSGSCTLSGTSVSFDHAGSCVVDADQAGDANYAPAPRVRQTITIGPATPTMSWPDPADIPYGTALGPGQLDATASVAGAFSYSPAAGTVLDVGAHLLHADFTPADGTDYTSGTAAASITVVPAGTTIAVTAAPDPAHYGDAVTLSADLGHATGASGTLPPGGTVTFAVDGQQVGSPVTLTNDRADSAPVTGLGAGSHTITATYSGDSRYRGSSDTEPLAVDRAAQTVAFTSAPPSPPTFGDDYRVSATATSGLPVQLSIDPSSTSGACTLSGDTVSFTGVGSCVIDADQLGDANYAPAPEAQQSVGIGKATPALAWSTPDAITFGTALGADQLDATASVPGSFTYSPAAGTLLTPGSHALHADFTPADAADYNATSVSTRITVDPAATALTLTSTPDAPHFGEQVDFAARLAAAPAATGATPPTGTVTFEVDGHQLGDPVTLSGGTTVSPPATELTGGRHTITASYSGDADYLPSRGSLIVTVAPADQRVGFTSRPPAHAVVGDRYAVSAAASSGLPVSFSVAAASAGVCVLHGTEVVFVRVGTCVIEAGQPGDADFAAAAVATQSVRVRAASAGSGTAAPPSGGSTAPASADSGTAPSAAGGGSLAATGEASGPLLGFGLLLVAAGVAIAGAATRRRGRSH